MYNLFLFFFGGGGGGIKNVIVFNKYLNHVFNDKYLNHMK